MTSKTFTTLLGSVTDPAFMSGLLASTDFSQQYWVQVDKLEADGLTFTPIGSRTKLNVVPYALWSAQGGSVTSVSAGKGLVAIGGTGDVALSVKAGAGIMVSLGGVSIASGGVNNAMLATEAVTTTKLAAGSVTDAKITGPIAGAKISPTGLNSDTVDGKHASELASSVHNHDASYVNVSGDTMSGGLHLPANGLEVGTSQLVATNGNVGIGTATPDARLNVSLNGTSAFPRALHINGAYGPVNSGRSIVFGDRIDYVRLRDVVEAGGQVGFSIDTAGAQSRIYVRHGGNVGIGTTTPSAKLEIVGDVKATGSGASATITGKNSSATGTGVYGEANATGATVKNTGGYFLAAGTYGRGVYGQATGSSGEGGNFKATGNYGVGVQGAATATGTATNFGGYFYSAGNSGIGVKGLSTATTGANQGVMGQSNSTGGTGVYGLATATGANVGNTGGYFEAKGDKGHGVIGKATGAESQGGVFSSGFIGVHAWASDPGSYGVYGSGKNAGVYGEVDHFGAVSSSDSQAGVYGVGRIGVKAYGSQYDFYANGNVSTQYGPFTGGHDVMLAADFPNSPKRGYIVATTGKVKARRTDQGEISLSSTLPTVRLSDRPNDKTVFGVFISEGPLPAPHWYPAKDGDRFGVVNALGEGRVLVTNIRGDIQAGDYITTSAIAGYGQLQADDLLHSYTLGKAIETVDWDTVTETIEFNGKTYKVYLLGVVYTSG